MRKGNNKGFTLAELLIVVAIIAVLVAIAIPVFTTQLERSRESTDLSNVRAAYAEAVAEYLANGASGGATATVTNIKQTVASWQIGESEAVLYTRIDGYEGSTAIPNRTSGGSAWTVHVSAIPPSGSESVTTSVWVD